MKLLKSIFFSIILVAIFFTFYGFLFQNIESNTKSRVEAARYFLIISILYAGPLYLLLTPIYYLTLKKSKQDHRKGLLFQLFSSLIFFVIILNLYLIITILSESLFYPYNPFIKTFIENFVVYIIPLFIFSVSMGLSNYFVHKLSTN